MSWVEDDLFDAIIHSRAPYNEEELLRTLLYFELIEIDKETRKMKFSESSCGKNREPKKNFIGIQARD